MVTPRFPILTLLAASLLLIGLAGSAAADEAICISDEDCAPGEVCISRGAPDCAGEGCEPVWEAYCEDMRGAMPQPEPGCDSDADCEDGFYCFEAYSECVPDWLVPCTADADCGAGLRCTDISNFDDGWDDGGEGRDEPMPMPAPEPGQPDEDSGFDGGEQKRIAAEFYCLPEWLNPGSCDSDADCAEGFACETYDMCACGGAGGGGQGDTPPFPGEDPDAGEGQDPDFFPFEDEGCECWPSDEGYCQLMEIECSSDSDCPSGWSCAEGYTGGDCAVDSEGNSWCPTDDAPEMICIPPYYDDIAAGGGGGFDEALGGGSPRPDSAGADDLEGEGARPPTNQDDDSFTNRPDRNDGGCSAAPGSPAGLPAALGLLALIGMVLRRRS